MPVQRLTASMLSFLALFSGGALLVLFWVTLESVFIKRLTFSYLLRFSLPATVVILLGMIIILMLYIWLRLWKLEKVRTEMKADRNASSADWICRSLLRLPFELFWGTIAYGGLFIPVYHIVHFLVEGNSLWRVEESYWFNFLRSFLYEQTITLSAAILHYAVARRIIRPMLVTLKNVRVEHWPDKSFLSMLTTTFAGLLLVNLFSILWYVMVANVKDKSIEFEVLGPLIMLDSIFAASIFVLLAVEFRRELQVLIGSIRDWLAGDHSLNKSRMPILSHDEVGQLAMAFNKLQDHVNQEYEDLKKDLHLSRQVQIQLLPAPRQVFGDYEVLALTESRHAVGSGFYDVMASKTNGFAAIVGGIKGSGMPAALYMSAAQLLLRAEIEQGNAPDQILSRFNQSLSHVFPQEAIAHVSLILVDTYRNVLHTELQGGMNVRRIRKGQLEQLPANEEIPFCPGDRWLLYSEPAAEAAVAIAAGLTKRAESSNTLNLDAWITRFMQSTSTAEEDFTLLLITRRCEMEVQASEPND